MADIFILCEDVLHVIMDLICDSDRIRLATVCRKMAQVVGRFRTRSLPVQDPFFVVRDIGILFSEAKLVFNSSDDVIPLLFDSFVLDPNGRANDYVLGKHDNRTVQICFRATRDQRLFFLTYPAAITALSLRKHTLSVSLDLSRIPEDTINVTDVFDQIRCNRVCMSTEFFTGANYHHDTKTERTPPTAILKDIYSCPFTWPRTLTLRTHQRVCLDYFLRMEQRVIHYQPLGSFPQWVPIKHANQLFWWDACSLTCVNTEHTGTIRVRPPPQEERIEYTSRVFWLADEHGMGKTILMLCLLLGPNQPLLPLDYVDVYIPEEEQRKRRTTASLVVVHSLMAKGRDSWPELAKQLYPDSMDRVYLVDSTTQWKELTPRMIQEARLVIMTSDFYNSHYNRAVEYSDPETKSTVLHYMWQRAVFDDNDYPIVDKLSAHMYYIITKAPGMLLRAGNSGIERTMQIRRLGSETWDCSPTDKRQHLAHYIQKQCTWRRTVRSVANELVRPRLLYRKQPIPLTKAEQCISVHINSSNRTYDVPVCFRYKKSWLTFDIDPYIPADATHVSLIECVKSIDPVHFDAAIFHVQHIPSLYDSWPTVNELCTQVQTMSAPRQRVGSLAMAVLVLLQKYWTDNPGKKVLIVCPSKPSLLCLGNVLKEQQVPICCLPDLNELKYTPDEYAALKKMKRKHALAILVEAKNSNNRISCNKFKDIHHVLVLSSEPSPHTEIAEDMTNIRDSLARPLDTRSESSSNPIHIVTVHPMSIYNPEPVNLSDHPYCDLDQEELVLSL